MMNDEEQSQETRQEPQTEGEGRWNEQGARQPLAEMI